MTAEKMFKNLGYEKKEHKSEICYEKYDFGKIMICFDFEEKTPYFYSECDEDEYEVMYPLSKELLNAINKQMEELGW